MPHLDLSGEETAALIKELADITGNDRFPFSARIQTLRAILAKLRPEPARERPQLPRQPQHVFAAHCVSSHRASRIAFTKGRDAMVYRRDRVVWGAVLFRTTNPEVVEGAIVRRSDRLHWTSEAAKEEVLGWMRELARTNLTGEIEWQSAEDVTIGRFASDPNHVAVIRSMLLPLGKSPRMK